MSVEMDKKNFAFSKVATQSRGFTEVIGVIAAEVFPGMAVLGLPGNETAAFPSNGMVNCPLQIVTENSLFGKTVHDAIPASSNLSILRPQKGDRVLVRVAASIEVALMDELVHNGAGAFRLATSNDADAAVPLRAVSACGSTDTVRLVLAVVL